MNTLQENWIWVVAAVVIVGGIYALTKAGHKRRQHAEAKKYLTAIVALIDTFQEVVRETIGSHYTREDRTKIAIGMVAVMLAEKISVEQMSEDRAVFASVLMKSVVVLTRQNEISQPR